MGACFLQEETAYRSRVTRPGDRGHVPVTATAMGGLPATTPQGSLDSGSRFIALSSQLHLRAAEPLCRLWFPACEKEASSEHVQLISHSHIQSFESL